MPDVEEYLRLREMDAMLIQMRKATARMEDELNRLKRRENAKLEKEAQLKTLTQEAKNLSHQIAELDRQLSQRLDSAAAAALEEQGLQLLIRQQELEQEQEDIRTFLGGYEKTLAELRAEIENELTDARLQRDQAMARAKAIKDELPAEWREKYEKVAVQNLAHGPFTRITDTRCFVCQYAISRVVESEVDVQLLLKSCPGCGRLFLPYKAVAG
jgi:predicted  nucleic acid-binding Zn-ribbon protein